MRICTLLAVTVSFVILSVNVFASSPSAWAQVQQTPSPLLFVAAHQPTVGPTRKASVLTFTNQTATAKLTFTHTTFSKLEPDMMISGAAVGDFNNDGWGDLFVLGGGVTPDALFINQGNGSFTEEGANWGIAVQQRGAGATVGDYNQDGWLDIFVTSHGITETAAVGHHRLYRNNQNGTFTNVATEAGVNRSTRRVPDGFGATFGDYDLDGDLDLFVTGWQAGAEGNRLFRNNSNGAFTDVTESVGTFNTGLRGFSPCFADMNGDRYPELLVTGDFNTSRYFVNKHNGLFLDQSEAAGIKVPAYGMGSAIADLDNDGRLDWYVTAIYKATFGGEGNRLFLNQGNNRFSERAAAVGVQDGRWGWGTAAVDLNHDGWLDIVETNGWPLEAQFQSQPARVWLGQETGQFSEVASAVGLTHTLDGRGLLTFDYDNDGDQDIVITSNNEPLQLFRNELTGSDTRWLRIFLDTRAVPDLPPNGIGAHVQVRVGSTIYHRTIQACATFLSQSELSAHFGLASAALVDEIRVEWPNGLVTSVQNVRSNQTLKLSAGQQSYLPIISH